MLGEQFHKRTDVHGAEPQNVPGIQAIKYTAGTGGHDYQGVPALRHTPQKLTLFLYPNKADRDAPRYQHYFQEGSLLMIEFVAKGRTLARYIGPDGDVAVYMYHLKGLRLIQGKSNGCFPFKPKTAKCGLGAFPNILAE